jgi:hypothetical protein
MNQRRTAVIGMLLVLMLAGSASRARADDGGDCGLSLLELVVTGIVSVLGWKENVLLGGIATYYMAKAATDVTYACQLPPAPSHDEQWQTYIDGGAR